MSVVLDASVAIACLAPDVDRPRARFGSDQELILYAVVPQTFLAEVLNVLVKAERQRRGVDTVLAAQLERLDQAMLETDGSTLSRLTTHILPIACEHRLSIFDAAYLDLAMRRNLPLLTYDSGLRRAADAASIPLA